jgi:hypothetical protein
VPNDELRERYAVRLDRAAPDGDCPDDEAIWAASRGELPAKRASELLDHVAHCPACAESWRMAREISDLAELPQARPRRSNRAVLWLGAAAASVLLALVVVPPLVDDGPTGPTEEFRDVEGVTIETLVNEQAPLPRDEVVLRWTPGPAGTLYRVELATEEFDVIHRSLRVDTTEYLVPVEALSGIDPGSTLLWRVDALLPDDTRLSSPTFLVRVE